MKIPSLLYVCFWAIVSVLALTSVGVLLNKVDQFRNHSSVLQQILHTFLCFSLSYAILWNPSSSLYGSDSVPLPPNWCYPFLNSIFFSFKYMVESRSPNLFLIVIVALLKPSWFLLGSYTANPEQVYNTVLRDILHWFAWFIVTALATIIYQDVDQNINIEFYNPYFTFVLAPIISYLLFLYQTKLQCPVTSIHIPSSIKIIVGLIGNILANHYLQDKSILLFWLVVSLAIFWLGNIAMMQSTWHVGIFSFLVGAIVDIAGEIFGLNIYMLFVGIGCASLFIFIQHLDNFNRQINGVGGHRTNERVDYSSMV